MNNSVSKNDGDQRGETKVAQSESEKDFNLGSMNESFKQIFDLLKDASNAGEKALNEWNTLLDPQNTTVKAQMARAIDQTASVLIDVSQTNGFQIGARLAVTAAISGPHGLAAAAPGVVMEVMKGGTGQSKVENLLNTAGYLDDIANARAGKTEALQNNPYLAMFAKAPEKVIKVDDNIVAKERNTATATVERTIGKPATNALKEIFKQGLSNFDPTTFALSLASGANLIVKNVTADNAASITSSFLSVLNNLKDEQSKQEKESISPKENLRNHVTKMAKALDIDNDEIANQSMQHYGLAKQALSEAAEAIALKAVSEDKEFLDKLKAFYNEKEVNSEKWHKEGQDLTNIFSDTKLKVQLEIEKTDKKYKKRNITETKTYSAEAIASANRITINIKKFLTKKKSDLKDYSDYNINPETKKDFETKKIFINDGKKKTKGIFRKKITRR